MARKVWFAAAVVAGTIGAGSAAWSADPAVNFAGSGSTFAGDCRGRQPGAGRRGAQRHGQGVRQQQPGQLDLKRRGTGHHRRSRQHRDPRPLKLFCENP